MDSSHAADLTFEFSVKNTGTEYARELSGIVVNVYIGDDTSPTISYPAWEKFPNGKIENLFPVGPNTPSGQFSVRTFTTNPIALTLEQMKRIDLGERLTVKVESYSYGADELFYTNAVTGGVTVFIEDGVEDGDETVDTYVIPTWGVESVQDVLTRYFRCPPGQRRRGRQPQRALDAGVRRGQPADVARALPLRHRLVERLPDAGRRGRHLAEGSAGAGRVRHALPLQPRLGPGRLQRPGGVPLLLRAAGGRPRPRALRRRAPAAGDPSPAGGARPATWPSAAGTW